MKIKYKKISWKVFEQMLNNLVHKIKKSNYKFDGIYGVPKGGIIIAVCLAYKLNLPLLLYPTNNSLLVDDISDSGNTLKNIKHKKIATLFSSTWTKVIPNYFIKIKKDMNSWIIFPWE
jgi:hypoxanthine phosphoribosyltransferase